MDLQLTVFGVLLVLSLAMSAFFAGAETALVSLGRIDMQRLRENADRPAVLIRALKAQTPRLLATILIGQNLFNSAASALATALATTWVGETWGVPAAILFSTIVLFIFAEMTPKAIGAASPVAISRAVAAPLTAMMKVVSPVATLVVKVTTRMLRLLGIPEKEPTLTEEEMKSVINLERTWASSTARSGGSSTTSWNSETGPSATSWSRARGSSRFPIRPGSWTSGPCSGNTSSRAFPCTAGRWTT